MRSERRAIPPPAPSPSRTRLERPMVGPPGVGELERAIFGSWTRGYSARIAAALEVDAIGQAGDARRRSALSGRLWMGTRWLRTGAARSRDSAPRGGPGDRARALPGVQMGSDREAPANGLLPSPRDGTRVAPIERRLLIPRSRGSHSTVTKPVSGIHPARRRECRDLPRSPVPALRTPHAATGCRAMISPTSWQDLTTRARDGSGFPLMYV